MPVAVRRAVVERTRTTGVVGSGQRSARSDRRGMEALDVISVSPVPDGPFGQDLPYGRCRGTVNAVVHQLLVRPGSTIHQFCTDVDESWTSRQSGPGAVTRPSRTSRSAAETTTSPPSGPPSSDRREPARST